MQTEIRVLSIRQPFADLVIFADKWSENRTWNTNYRGPLFIHASRWDDGWCQSTDCGNASPFLTGHIIGRVDVIACCTPEDLEPFDGSDPRDIRDEVIPELRPHVRALNSVPADSWIHVQGPYCFILANPKALKVPILIGGKLGIWRLTVDPGQLKFKRKKHAVH